MYEAGLCLEAPLDLGCAMDRQVVQYDDQFAFRPTGAQRREQFQKLLMPTVPAYPEHHVTAAHLQSRQHSQGSMAPVVDFDPLWPPRRRWAPRMQAFKNLDLGLLVHTDDPGTPARVQIQAHDAPHLAAKLRIGAVQPTPEPMRFEGRLAQPSADGALGDSGPQIAPAVGRFGQRAHSPVGTGRSQPRLRMTGKSKNLMPLF